VAAPAADSNVVLQKDDVKKVAHPAKKLAGVAIADKAGAQRVSVKTDGEVGKYTLIELKDPARLALDLSGVEGKSATLPGKGAVKSVRVAKHDGGVRVVVDGAGDKMPSYEIERRADGLEVRIGEVAVAKAPASTPAKIEAARPEPVKAAPTAVAAIEGSKIAVAPSVIKAVDLRLIEGKTEVAVLIDGAYQFETSRVGTNTAVLTLKGVTLPERLERKLDAKELNAGVEMLTSYRVPGQTNEVRIVASLKNAVKADAQADKTGVRWTFEEQQKLAAVLPLAQTATTKAAAAASEAKAQTNNGNVLDDKNYTGRRVDFNVKDIDIKNLLNAIADISKKNVIVADDVKGTVSIKLRNVPWDQALDIILKSKGLGKEEIGNIIRVAPLERLRAEQKEAAEAKKVQQTFEPLKVRLVSVNYATASGMADKIKDTLSDRGTVSVDTRTNTLIIKDVQEALLRAEAIVRNLDTQTPEVLIESRIVEASTTFSRQVGIQWGGNVAFGPSTGNPTGLVFPSILQVAGAADDANGSSNGLGTTQPNFAVNMPAPIGAGAGGGVGFTFGSAGGAANLNLRLSAAESNGTLKTISSPRVVALDSVESTIGQGVSIPFSQVSAAGVNTTFIDAKLELKVQVHVTQEGSIQMKISATNNQPNSQLTGANGQPSLSKREAKTEVLVKDGDTTVIGGIYTRSTSESWKEVP
ncbi:MAG: type IV pilus secretin PilQ, partial [Deltaproteobacteria bacterium]|nr:type IV pilus secretin PilQ [Deltaproteobacteria bacterium]